MHCNSMPDVHRSVAVKILQIQAFMTDEEPSACAVNVLKALEALDEQTRTTFAPGPDLLVAHGMIAGSMKRRSGEPQAHWPGNNVF